LFKTIDQAYGKKKSDLENHKSFGYAVIVIKQHGDFPVDAHGLFVRLHRQEFYTKK